MLIIQTYIFIFAFQVIFVFQALFYQLLLDIIYSLNKALKRFFHHYIGKSRHLIQVEKLVLPCELHTLFF